MIEAYTLESLLKKYGIDATKVINKNNNILEYGEYQDIDKLPYVCHVYDKA
jgi:ferredoxin